MKSYFYILFLVCFVFGFLQLVSLRNDYATLWAERKTPYDNKNAYIIASMAQDTESKLLQLGITPKNIFFRVVHSVNHSATESGISVIPATDDERKIWIAQKKLGAYRTLLLQENYNPEELSKDQLALVTQNAIDSVVSLSSAESMQSSYLKKDLRYKLILSAAMLYSENANTKTHKSDKVTELQVFTALKKTVDDLIHESLPNTIPDNLQYTVYLYTTARFGIDLISSMQNQEINCNSTAVQNYRDIQKKIFERLGTPLSNKQEAENSEQILHKLIKKNSWQQVNNRLSELCPT
jgi:hypothetical protein